MQCTEKYFEADAFRTRAESVLLAAVPDSRTGGGLLALEGTVFYPEGGGQPADRGTLTLPDGTELAVTDVHEQDGILWHSVPSLPDTAVPGITVEEAIDWDWRFDKMQQHTGEHILSGILHRMFGAENVGFHIGAEAVRMDTSVPISAEGLRAAELEANRIVWQDVPVVITYPTPQELAALTYRSKKEIDGQVRIVTIPGADVCACCGTHTRTTGQVGQIKILTSENYKGGVRLSIVCGARALEAAQAMRARQADIGALLSAKADQTAVAVHRVYDEYTALKFNHFGLCSQLFQAATKSNNFKELHTYYFHNCVYSEVYTHPGLRWDSVVPTEWLLQNYDASYKVIIVGDGAMSPYELREPRYDWEKRTYGDSGLAWLERLRRHYPYLIWLNPEPMPARPDYWSQTHWQLAQIFHMYDLSAEGLEQGMKRLMVRR